MSVADVKRRGTGVVDLNVLSTCRLGRQVSRRVPWISRGAAVLETLALIKTVGVEEMMIIK